MVYSCEPVICPEAQESTRVACLLLAQQCMCRVRVPLAAWSPIRQVVVAVCRRCSPQSAFALAAAAFCIRGCRPDLGQIRASQEKQTAQRPKERARSDAHATCCCCCLTGGGGDSSACDDKTRFETRSSPDKKHLSSHRRCAFVQRWCRTARVLPCGTASGGGTSALRARVAIPASRAWGQCVIR